MSPPETLASPSSSQHDAAPSRLADSGGRGSRTVQRAHSDQKPKANRSQRTRRKSMQARKESQDDGAASSRGDGATSTRESGMEHSSVHHLSGTTPDLHRRRLRSSTDVHRDWRVTNPAHPLAPSRTVNGGFHDSSPPGSRVEQEGSSLMAPRRPPPLLDLPVRPSSRLNPPGLQGRRRDAERSGPGVMDRPLSNSRDFVLPTWQPDSEVPLCPICFRQFTFWFRKHHCRKCGRVVCAGCSPHRITIPRQFIVRPAEVAGSTSTTSVSNPAALDSTNSTEFPHQQGLGGGDEVRLCNPCVPDPQPNPERIMDLEEFLHSSRRGQGDDHYNHPAYSHLRPSSGNPSDLSAHYWTSHEARELRRQRGRGMIFQPENGNVHAMQTDGEEIPDESLPAYGNFNYTLIPNYGGPGRSPHRHLNHSPISSPPSYAPRDIGSASVPERETSHLASARNVSPSYPGAGGAADRGNDVQRRSSRTYVPAHARYSSMDGAARPALPRSNRPRVRSSLEIEPAFPRSGSFSRYPASSAQRLLREEDVCPVCRCALPARGADGDETTREAHIRDCIASRDRSRSTGSPSSPSMMYLPPLQPIHMVPFAASEKDCLGEDGTSQECSICFVEYEVGDSLARLECLCKFHRSCIVQWFSRKQECPVHKVA